MKYRMLGDSGLRVSVLAFGAWQLGDPDYWGEDVQTDATATVQAAIDGGINLFDTAEMYGDGASEEILGKALAGKREQVFIASKVAPQNCSPNALRAACEASLTRLNTDYIDLYQVHWPSREIPFEETYGTLKRLQEEGKIRHVGVSNFGKEDLTTWLEGGGTVSNQLGYNALYRAIEYEILPLCRRRDVGVLSYMPLMQGLLTGRWLDVDDIPLLRRRTRHFSNTREGVRHSEAGCERELMRTVGHLKAFSEAIGIPFATVSLCWVLAQPGVTSAIVGARKPEQLQRNLQAADLDLGPAALAQLNEMTWPLKQALGSNADMWQSGEEARIR